MIAGAELHSNRCRHDDWPNLCLLCREFAKGRAAGIAECRAVAASGLYQCVGSIVTVIDDLPKEPVESDSRCLRMAGGPLERCTEPRHPGSDWCSGHIAEYDRLQREYCRE